MPMTVLVVALTRCLLAAAHTDPHLPIASLNQDIFSVLAVRKAKTRQFTYLKHWRRRRLTTEAVEKLEMPATIRVVLLRRRVKVDHDLVRRVLRRDLMIGGRGWSVVGSLALAFLVEDARSLRALVASVIALDCR